MQDYTLLFFQSDDSVARVQTLRAHGHDEAARMADVISHAFPTFAGYQLWHQGERVVSTFPGDPTQETAIKRVG
jgi:hypothetical protein